MSESGKLGRLAVHESVESVVPKDDFVAAFDDLPIPAELVGDDETYRQADAVATYVPRPEFLDASWVHCIRAGYDEFDTNRYEAAEVPLTNSTGIHGATVSEVAIGYMLSLARLHHQYRDHQNERNWFTPGYDRPFTIENETVCVVGLGTIGDAIARRAAALGMEVVGVRRSGDSVPSVSTVYHPNQLHEAISDARFVALAAPHTPSTEGMIGEDEFNVMRDDGYLINVSRGPLVDQGALVDALHEDRIAGAGLDVFEEEPLPEDSPLWDFTDVVLSPHKGSATNRYHLDLAELTAENVRRFQADENLKNRVA